MWYVVFKSEKMIEDVDKLTEGDIIKFYVRYVDNTILAIKMADKSYVLNEFNIFDDNIKFTIDTPLKTVYHISLISRFIQMA